MDTMRAFMMGDQNRTKPLMVFDWIKAVKIIKEKGAKEASAGLKNDWEYTGGTILKDGEPYFDDYAYLASTWATPEIEIDGEKFDCFIMQYEKPDWDSATKWPKEAIELLKSLK